MAKIEKTQMLTMTLSSDEANFLTALLGKVDFESGEGSIAEELYNTLVDDADASQYEYEFEWDEDDSMLKAL